MRLQVKVWFQNRRMKWRHQEEVKNTTSDKEDDVHFVACTTSASDVIDDDRSMRTGSECGVPAAAASNSRKPASIMSVADILDLRVAAGTPSISDDVTSGQNSADPRRL